MSQTVATSQTEWEAHLIIILLRQNGLHPEDLQTSPHISFAGPDQTYAVRLPAVEMDAAAELLNARGHSRNVEAER